MNIGTHPCVFREMEDEDVSVVDCLGDDYTPFRAARMSYDKNDRNIISIEELGIFTENLIRKGHLVPFEHCVLTFDVKAPIFVFRQLFRYRTMAISEKSMRWTEPSLEFYLPPSIAENEELAEMCCAAVKDDVAVYYTLLEKRC